jgi:hypothetical protein
VPAHAEPLADCIDFACKSGACRCLVLENFFYIYLLETVEMDAPGFNPFPTGSHVEVWWAGDRQWYAAKVTDTRIELHKVKGAKVPCHEVHCVYELDGHEQWHSLHNNKMREKIGVAYHISHDH